MVETLDQQLEPGGGGGIDRPLRPTENYDDEEPDKRERIIAAIRDLHVQRYGPREHRGYLGVPPTESTRRRNYKLSVDAARTALQNFDLD